jgi:hypothetical protein
MTSESSTPKPSRIFLPGIALLKRLGKNARFWVIPAPLVLALCVLFSMHLTELLTDDSSAASQPDAATPAQDARTAAS